MEQPQIKIYIGEIDKWAGIYQAEERAETICGRLLLLYGLLRLKEGQELFLADTLTEAYQKLKEQLVYGTHGKPALSDSFFPHFNISHSGNMRCVRCQKCPAVLIYRKKKS